MADDCDRIEGGECADLTDFYSRTDSWLSEDSLKSDQKYIEMISYHYKLSETCVKTQEVKTVTYASKHTVSGYVVHDNVMASTHEDLTANGFNFILED